MPSNILWVSENCLLRTDLGSGHNLRASLLFQCIDSNIKIHRSNFSTKSYKLPTAAMVPRKQPDTGHTDFLAFSTANRFDRLIVTDDERDEGTSCKLLWLPSNFTITRVPISPNQIANTPPTLLSCFQYTLYFYVSCHLPLTTTLQMWR